MDVNVDDVNVEDSESDDGRIVGSYHIVAHEVVTRAFHDGSVSCVGRVGRKTNSLKVDHSVFLY